MGNYEIGWASKPLSLRSSWQRRATAPAGSGLPLGLGLHKRTHYSTSTPVSAVRSKLVADNHRDFVKRQRSGQLDVGRTSVTVPVRLNGRHCLADWPTG